MAAPAVASVQMLVLVVLCGVLATQAQTDEDLRRPYKFGFTIENQHRREEKDERGIIMGEFGFITADGWYLTTIYATDEEGRFKILGRKRERVGPPLNPYSQVAQVTTARPFQSSTPTRVPITISSPRPFQTPTTFRPTTFRPITSTAFQQAAVTQSAVTQQQGAFQGIRGCGSCIIPTTTPRPVDSAFVSTTAGFRPSSSSGGSSSSGAFGSSQSGGQIGSGNSGFNAAGGGGSSGFNSGGSSGAFRPISGSNRPNSAGGFTATTASSAAGFTTSTNAGGFRPSIVSTTAGFVATASTTRRPPGFSQQPAGGGFNRPTSPGYPPSGVPQGGRRPTSIADSLTGGSALNYKFNYTAGYHGHHETGYRDGSKMGGYFVNNRDGVGHRVVYDANEFGFQPKVSQVKLSPDDTPRQETERDSGRPTFNEFLWFKR